MIKNLNKKTISRLGLLILLVALVFSMAKIGQGKVGSYSDKNISCNGSPCNIILIVNDALAAKHLSLYGYGRATSPFLDEYFGKEGVVFENAYAQAPWTIPSVASFLTSQYPSEIYVETMSDKLSKDIRTFIEPIRESGVELAIYPQGILQPRRVKALDASGEVDREFGILERFREGEIKKPGSDPLLLRSAAEWIKSRTKPFLVLLHAMTVHSPYDPPPNYRSLFDGPTNYPGSVTWDDLREVKMRPATAAETERFTRQYDQEVRYLDDLLKEFLQSLPEEVLQRSLIILTSDHGEAFGEHGRFEHASTLYEEMIKVPFMIRSPGLTPKKISQPMSLLDLGPTILDVFGLPKEGSFRGRSLLPLLGGEFSPDVVVRMERANVPADSNYKEGEYEPQVRNTPLPYAPRLAARLGNWKLIRNPDDSIELYNLLSDPGEKTNLFSKWESLLGMDKKLIGDLYSELGLPLPN